MAPGGHRARTDRGWAAYVLGWRGRCARAGLPVGGTDILLDGRVPLGAGLSSSAAIGCAGRGGLVGPLRPGAARGRRRAGAAGRAGPARRTGCQRADGQDGPGGRDAGPGGPALLLDCRDGHTEQVAFGSAQTGLCLLVIDTRRPPCPRRRAVRRPPAPPASGRPAARDRDARESTPGWTALTGWSTGSAPTAGRRGGPAPRAPRGHRDRPGPSMRGRLAAGDWGGAGRLFAQSRLATRRLRSLLRGTGSRLQDGSRHGALGARMTGGGLAAPRRPGPGGPGRRRWLTRGHRRVRRYRIPPLLGPSPVMPSPSARRGLSSRLRGAVRALSPGPAPVGRTVVSAHSRNARLGL